MIPLTSQPAADAASADGAGAAAAYALLFDADGSDRELAIDGIELARLSERQRVWIDLQQREGQDVWACLRKLGLEEAAQTLEERKDQGQPRLQNFGDWFLVQVVAVAHPGSLRFTAQPLTLVIGRNFVVTVHRDLLPFLDQLRERERGDTQVGMLSAESFTVSLLDWQLTTYFEAIAELESEIDRMEVQMLARRMRGEHLPDLARMRRGASQLRRLLAPHRAVFGAMARPDFRPDPEGTNDKQFRALNERFERSMDAVENARDLVIGSFELFATRTAHRTNETMRVLTFVTVLLGSLSVLAGVLGMNFEAPLFRTGQQGFVVTIVTMLVLVAIAVAVARWRRWL
jgi:magnesium transporter